MGRTGWGPPHPVRDLRQFPAPQRRPQRAAMMRARLINGVGVAPRIGNGVINDDSRGGDALTHDFCYRGGAGCLT
jgi:hypothetical protein